MAEAADFFSTELLENLYTPKIEAICHSSSFHVIYKSRSSSIRAKLAAVKIPFQINSCQVV